MGRALLAEWWRYVTHQRLNEPVLALAQHIQQAGYRVGILSNAAPGLEAELRTDWGIAFSWDAVVASGDVGMRKPDPAIYHLAAQRLGSEPSDCCFVDDRSENVAAARAVGMHAIGYDGNTDLLVTELQRAGFIWAS